MNDPYGLRDDWHRRITNHPPSDDIIHATLDYITQEYISIGDKMIAVCPNSRELNVVLTKLEEACMWSKAAVARNQDQLIPKTKKEA